MSLCHVNWRLSIERKFSKNLRNKAKIEILYTHMYVLTHVIQLQAGGCTIVKVVAERVDLTRRHLVWDLIIRVIQNVVQGQVDSDEEVRPVRLAVR